MSDNAPTPSRVDQVQVYLEALQPTLEPDQFELLTNLFQEVLDFVAGGVPDGTLQLVFDEDDDVPTAVRDELMVLMAILTTGRMDQAVVDLGDGVTTVVTEEESHDPARMDEIHRFARGRARVEDDLDRELRRIVGTDDRPQAPDADEHDGHDDHEGPDDPFGPPDLPDGRPH